MILEKHEVYHIYNQGNNREPIFFKRKNYNYFLEKMKKYILPYADILSYCLMPNHFHWLVFIHEVECPIRYLGINDEKSKVDFIQKTMNQSIGILLRSYCRGINKQEARKGSLFQSKTKAKPQGIDEFITIDGPYKDYFFTDDDAYIRQCFHYIHQNPVKARLVNRPEDWEFSSAREYKGLVPGICNQELTKWLTK